MHENNAMRPFAHGVFLRSDRAAGGVDADPIAPAGPP
jgi:hypothetical protein